MEFKKEYNTVSRPIVGAMHRHGGGVCTPAAHVASKSGLETEAHAEINANKQYPRTRRYKAVLQTT